MEVGPTLCCKIVLADDFQTKLEMSKSLNQLAKLSFTIKFKA